MTTLSYRNDQEWAGVDRQQLLDLLDGTVVRSGYAPSLQGGNFKVDVASGEGFVDGSAADNNSTQTNTHSQASNNPRKDIGYIDSGGTLQLAEGNEETADPGLSDNSVNDDPFKTQRPAPPDHATIDGIVIYEAWIDPDDTSIGSQLPTANDALRDRRLDEIGAAAAGVTVASGSVTLSSGSAYVDTGYSGSDPLEVRLSQSTSDSTGTDVAATTGYDDSGNHVTAGNHYVKIEDVAGDNATATVNYTVIR